MAGALRAPWRRGRWGGAGPSTGQREPPRVYLVGVALGGLLGLVAYLAGSLGLAAAGVVVIAGGAVVATVAAGSARRLLLAILLLDIPFQWDQYLDYRTEAGELGAIAGLNISLTSFALAGLYALWAAELAQRASGDTKPRLRAAAPLLVYLGLNLLSLPVAADPALAWYYVVLLAQSVLIFIYIASRVRGLDEVSFIVGMLLLGLLLESLLIMGTRLTGINFDYLGLSNAVDPSHMGDPATSVADTGYRSGGTIGSPNTAGSYLAMLLPLAAVAVATPVSGGVRRLASISLAAGSIALVFTFSRGGWLATAVAFALLLVLGVRRGLLSPRLLAVAVAIALLIVAPLYGAVGARLTGDDKGAAESRVPLMELAGRVIKDHPVLGVGPNNFAVVIPDYAGPEFSRDWIYTVHNKYLLVAAETGLVALAAFVWFLVAIVRRGLRVSRLRDRLLSPVALGLTVAVIGQIVQMAVELFQSRPQLQLLLVIGGLITALARMTGQLGE
jgi:putative inorganic carbon (hco3(-)) transporter